MPIAVAHIGAAEHAHIDSVDLGMVSAAEFSRLGASLKRVSCRLEFAEVKRDYARKMIGLDQRSRVATSFRKVRCLMHEACGAPKIGAHVIDITQSPQGE